MVCESAPAFAQRQIRPVRARAAAGLETWRSLTGAADLTIEDDGGDRGAGDSPAPVASQCDLLLRPVSAVWCERPGGCRSRALADWNRAGPAMTSGPPILARRLGAERRRAGSPSHFMRCVLMSNQRLDIAVPAVSQM